MNTKLSLRDLRSLICIGALAAGSMLSSPLFANDYNVTVGVPVSLAGLDLSQVAAARELYGRLSNAARVVCTDGRRVDLKPAENYFACYENALGAAVRSVNRPQLTMQYLATHTFQDAATRGITVPAQVAAR